MVDPIQKELFAMQDKQYAVFQSKLLPSIDPATIIGVRTPLLRAYAKKVAKMVVFHDFITDLPHLVPAA